MGLISLPWRRAAGQRFDPPAPRLAVHVEPRVSEQDRCVLSLMVDEVAREGTLVAEIGSFLGNGSAPTLAEKLRPLDGLLYCVDTWRGNQNVEWHQQLARDFDLFATFRDHVHRHDAVDMVKPLVMPSRDAARVFAGAWELNVAAWIVGVAGIGCIGLATILWIRAGRTSGFVARCCIPVVSVVFVWSLVEAGAWLVLEYGEPVTHVGRWEFRASRPAPYRNASYFSPAFLRESMGAVRSLTVPRGRNYSLPGDVRGKFFNVKDGRRRTTDQPAHASRRILVFGASTVFCQESPDHLTLPSCLQREINRRSPESCRVENHSSVTMIALQQTARLRDTPIGRNDIVIFYDGFNDVFHPVYAGKVKSRLPGEPPVKHDAGVRKLSWLEKTTYPVWLRFHDGSPFSRLMLRPYEGYAMIRRPEAEWMKANLKIAGPQFEATLRDAAAISSRHGARFVHVLQPNLFTIQHMSAYEKRVAKSELVVLPGLDQAVRIVYPRYREIINRLNGEGMLSFDLSLALEDRSPGTDYYLDFCHVNHAANQRLAELIAECPIQAALLRRR
jgi:hypothetical protein